jgi:hypothetical protein
MQWRGRSQPCGALGHESIVRGLQSLSGLSAPPTPEDEARVPLAVAARMASSWRAPARSRPWTAKEIGLEAFPPDDRPPVVIPFFAFRIMVGSVANFAADGVPI